MTNKQKKHIIYLAFLGIRTHALQESGLNNNDYMDTIRQLKALKAMCREWGMLDAFNARLVMVETEVENRKSYAGLVMGILSGPGIG